jgi:hypothetical protein
MIKKLLQRGFQRGILLFVAAKNAKKQHSLKKEKQNKRLTLKRQNVILIKLRLRQMIFEN